MNHTILGTTMPALEVRLEDGESIVADTGELSWMSSNIVLHTTIQGGGKGGIFGAIKRMVGGGTLFLTEYTAAEGRSGSVTFATKMPGSILPIFIESGSGYMVHRHGFIAGTQGIEISSGFQRTLGSGIFGGTGLILQKLGGQGQAWISLSGEVIIKDLAPGEMLKVHPGHVGMFQESVAFDVTTIKGISNAIFGGDGFFLATLTGPGRIWLQTLPLPNLAHALEPYLPNNRDNKS